MNKWYMHIPLSVLENETHKYLWEFEIQTDHLISAIQPDLVIIIKKRDLQEKKKRKKKRELAELWTCHPGWPQSTIERKWKAE